ncbi:hypothetical protein B566_EDAN017756 [Ephemera danica]|nr:hypothetical protein B566_EDAN017756 [Ephemera danica]
MCPLSLQSRHLERQSGWLGALSAATALLLSPVTIAFCRRKSTRVTAVLGGLVAALGCLFTSFATQFHQLFFSYALVLGVGVGMTRDTSTLMVAQYFKRRRELVEIFIVAGSGLGLALMSAFIRGAVRAVGWRLGLQAVTCAVFFTFFLGTFYRSASLYHPQRRAILHLKNQKRKVKDKSKPDDKPPFFDVSTLRSKTTCLGLAWALGCAALGLLVVRNSADCRIARQYLCQACAFVSGLAILALTAVQGYRGYLLFVWVRLLHIYPTVLLARGRRLSFTDEDANGHAGGVLTTSCGASAAAAALLGQRSLALANMGGSGELKKPELTLRTT